MDAATLAGIWHQLRPELSSYLRRLVARADVAEDICQSAYLRAFESMESAPETEERVRAWLFRIATNLGIDELRKHANWRESALLDLRKEAEVNPEFLRLSTELIGTPETKNIAREHLAACFSCALRNFTDKKAATLLLKEVHGFSIREIADWLEASPSQVKNWLQETRQRMDERYKKTCSLISKQGVCYQCVELDEFFNADRGSPIPGPDRSVNARIAVLRELRQAPQSRWHQLMFDLLDDIGLA